MKELCKGCGYLRGENEIGVAYCQRHDKIIFSDQSSCEDRIEIPKDGPIEKWISYDEKGYGDIWKHGDNRYLCVYSHRPELDSGIGGYVDKINLSIQGENLEASDVQVIYDLRDKHINDVSKENLMDVIENILPGLHELPGTNDLLRVTIEKIKG